MTAVVEQPCWKVFGWGKGRWTLRSTHLNHQDAADAAEYIYHRNHVRTRVVASTTRVAVPTNIAPTSAQRFREQQADAMMIRRQTHAYFKSGCNGTELIHTSGEDRD